MGRRIVRHPVWLLAPLVVLFLVAYGYPLLKVFELALLREDTGEQVNRLLSVAVYARVLERTVLIAAVVAAATVALAYPLAAFIAQRPSAQRRLLFALVFLPLLTSVVVRTYSWTAILRPDGVLDGLLGLAGLPALDGALYHNEAAVLIGMVHLMLPFATLPIYAGFSRIDPQLRMAAASLGADAPRQWLRVVYPLTLPSTLAASLLVFLSAIGFVVTPQILGGPRAVMLGVLISQQAARNDLPFSALLATILVLATAAVVAGGALLARRFAARGAI